MFSVPVTLNCKLSKTQYRSDIKTIGLNDSLDESDVSSLHDFLRSRKEVEEILGASGERTYVASPGSLLC